MRSGGCIISRHVQKPRLRIGRLCRGRNRRIDVKAFKLGLAGFLVPFAWVFGPQLIMQGTPFAIILSVLTALIGVLSLGVAVEGFFWKWHIRRMPEVLLAAASIMLVIPGFLTDTIAAGLVFIASFLIWRSSRFMPEEWVPADN